MNKLTEIKERNVIERYGRSSNRETEIFDIILDDVAYLLSLLEEKDKALAFYADESRTFEEISDDGGFIARKALNTSSNNERETI